MLISGHTELKIIDSIDLVVLLGVKRNYCNGNKTTFNVANTGEQIAEKVFQFVHTLHIYVMEIELCGELCENPNFYKVPQTYSLNILQYHGFTVDTCWYY